jgi:hypothetical protein
LIAYAAGAAAMAAQWLLGCLALAWLLRGARPAPERAARLFAELTAGRGRLSRGRLLASPRAKAPFSFGLLRPTVVLPAALAEADGPQLRWALAHELAHLERRDAWGCLLFGIGQVVYYVLPWFWALRRQVRLSQEYLADAAAVEAGGPAEDYAQFLLSWAHAPAPPAAAAGVGGRRSDLFRRITMLLKSTTPLERRCPRRWALGAACALLSLAVLGAGVGLKAAADQPREEPKKQEPKKEEPKKEEPKKGDLDRALVPDLPDLDDLLKDLKGLNADQADLLRRQMELLRKEMRRGLELARPGAAGRMGLSGQPQEGRLGAVVERPGDALVDQLDLPRGQGVVVREVQDGSAAAKAGLKPHDILLELNGKPASSEPAEFARQVGEIKADTPVDAVVLRKGKKETIKGLTLPEAKAAPARGGLRFEFPAVPFGPAPGIRGLGGRGGNGSLSISRNNDDFTVKETRGDVTITVAGRVADGKPVVSEVEVQDGKDSSKYVDLEKVPEAHRARARELADMAAGGRARFELRRP